MAQTFMYCYEHKELEYGLPSSNGVYSKDQASSNHWQCVTHVFYDPMDYAPPIRMVLIKLGAGVEIHPNEMILFKLAMQIEDVPPNRPKGAKAPDLEEATIEEASGRWELNTTEYPDWYTPSPRKWVWDEPPSIKPSESTKSIKPARVERVEELTLF